MNGPKEATLEAFVRDHLPSLSFVRFDYSGHGLSSGTFTGTHLGDWFKDALAVFDEVTEPGSKQIVAASSMGGLLALHLALHRPDRVAALVLIAPAVGFAGRRWARLTDERRRLLISGGLISLDSGFHDDSVNIAFFEAAKEFNLPEKPGLIPIHCPVRILHGGLDDAVPIEISERLVGQIAGSDVTLTEVKDGSHKLAKWRDLRLLESTVAQVYRQLCLEAEAGSEAPGAA